MTEHLPFLHIHINTFERQLGELLQSLHENIRLAAEDKDKASRFSIKNNIYRCGACATCAAYRTNAYTNRSGAKTCMEKTTRRFQEEACAKTIEDYYTETIARIEQRAKTLEDNHTKALARIEQRAKTLEDNHTEALICMKARIKTLEEKETIYHGIYGSAYPSAHINVIKFAEPELISTIHITNKN